MNEDKMCPTEIRDEISRMKGLITAISILITEGSHNEYVHDPVEDILLIIKEKLEKIDEVILKI